MAQPNNPALRIECLGRFRVMSGAAEINVAGAKTRALLAYLALTLGRKQPRDHLAELFWSDRFHVQARQSLRQSLRALRVSLGDASFVLVTDGTSVSLDPAHIEVDVQHAEMDFAAGRYDQAALALASDRVLPGLDLPERKFAHWLMEERARLRGLACTSLERLADRSRDVGHLDDAICAAQRLVSFSPLRESAHRLLMRLYAEAGRGAEAIAQYGNCVKILRNTLGAEPDPKTTALRDRIDQAARQAAAPGPSRALIARAANAAQGRPSIAVLPFTDLTERETHADFAQGLAEDLTTELSRFRWLSVSARRTRSNPVDFAHVGRALGVRYLVTGSVRAVEGRMRVSAKLVDADDCVHLWSERFDRAARGGFATQDELVASIAGSIEPALTSAELRRARRKSEWEMNAWDHYNQGAWHLFHYSQDEVAAARHAFRRAIRADPDFAAPHVGLAYACRYSLIFDYAETPDATLEEGLEAGRRAVSLDDQDFYAHTVLGRLHMIAREHESAISETRIAVERNANSAQAHFGLGLALTMAGEARRAMEPLTKAIALSPRDPNLSSYASVLSTSHILQRDYKKAAGWARVAMRQPSPHFIAQMHLVAALGLLGDRKGAEKACAKLLLLKPDFSLDYVVRNWPFKHASDTARFLRGLRSAGISN